MNVHTNAQSIQASLERCDNGTTHQVPSHKKPDPRLKELDIIQLVDVYNAAKHAELAVLGVINYPRNDDPEGECLSFGRILDEMVYGLGWLRQHVASELRGRVPEKGDRAAPERLAVLVDWDEELARLISDTCELAIEHLQRRDTALSEQLSG